MTEPRVYTTEEYIRGLEDQGIIVHMTMRDMIKRLNPYGVVEGYPAKDEGLFPPNNNKYKAGYLDDLREKQRKLEEAERARKLEEANLAFEMVNPATVAAGASKSPKLHLTKFDLMTKVSIDGGEVTGVIIRISLLPGGRIVYYVAWLHNGTATGDDFDEFRLKAV